jgi:hypothetical protein
MTKKKSKLKPRGQSTTAVGSIQQKIRQQASHSSYLTLEESPSYTWGKQGIKSRNEVRVCHKPFESPWSLRVTG